MKNRTILEFKKQGEIATMLKAIYSNAVVLMELDGSQSFKVGEGSVPADQNLLTGREIELRFNDSKGVDSLINDLTKIKFFLKRQEELAELRKGWKVYTQEFTINYDIPKDAPVAKKKHRAKKK